MALRIDEQRLVSFYGTADPSEVPLYTYAAASRTIKVPSSTVRWWVKGRNTEYEPVIRTGSDCLLSFNDLLELYVVKVLRNRQITLSAIRRAVDYAERDGIHRVLLSKDLTTFHRDILLEGLGETVALSRSGQRALHGLLDGLTKRVVRTEQAAPVLHPEYRGEQLVDGDYPVSVSPVIAFGAPVITGGRIETATIKARMDSGETVDEIAYDYSLAPAQITAAVIYEHAV